MITRDLLIEELEAQHVPANWITAVLSATTMSNERMQLMMDWLVEHRTMDYGTMEVVDRILEIKEIVPLEDFL